MSTEQGRCAECGTTFEYRPRGFPQLVCSDPCRAVRRRRQTLVRVRRWARRLVARELEKHA